MLAFHTAYLSLGSNMGDRIKNITDGVERLLSEKVRMVKISSMYETAPVGYEKQPDFINAALCVSTSLSPEELLFRVLDVEKELGRVRNIRWGPRVIDIDVLIYDDISMQTDALTIPHPRMRERAFVLVPLAEIAPNLVIPPGKDRAADLSENISDQRVRKYVEDKSCHSLDMK